MVPKAKDEKNIKYEEKTKQEIIFDRYMHTIDEAFDHVIFHASDVNMYIFNQEWVEMDIEGTLYIYRRDKDQGCRMIVLNRKGVNDFKLNVQDELDIRTEEKFIILDDLQTDNIFGIWFNNESKAQLFVETLAQIKESGVGS